MAQQVCHARVTIPSTTANIDPASFSFVFEATGAGASLDLDAINSPVTVTEAFFNATHSVSGFAIAQYISGDLNRTTNACQIAWTDVTAHLDGSPAGGPFRTDTFTLGPTSSSGSLPAGASLVCSYRGDYGNLPEHGELESLPTPDDAIDYGAPPTHMGKTRPRARLRSRLYVGPCTVAALGGDQALVSNACLNTAKAAINDICKTQNSGETNQFNLVVWSRRNAEVNAARWTAVSEAFGSVSRRSDPTELRVHIWIPVA